MRATAMVAGAMLVAALLPVVVARSAPIPPTTGPGGAPQALSPAGTLARIGPRFEANQGQLDQAVRFVSRAPGYSLFLTAEGAVMAMAGAEGGSGAPEVVRMRLVAANPHPKMTGGEVLAGKSNYLNGNDPGKWIVGVSSYATVEYHGIYPGIDLVYHGDEKGRVEYDFVVAPGADPGSIAMEFSGGKGIRLGPTGELVIATGAGDLRQHKPVLYQQVAGDRREVAGRFVINENRVGFEVAPYDRALPLVIDPVVTYSTYLGGNGRDEPRGIAVDADGFSYVVGTTTSTSFPTTEGAADRTCGSAERCEPLDDGYFVPRIAGTAGLGLNTAQSAIPRRPSFSARPDTFVTKLAPDGQVVYSTYLGGGGADEGLAVAVDASGRPYIAGRTKSPDFPTTENAYDRKCGTDGTCNSRLTYDPLDGPGHRHFNADAFVTKLDDEGGLNDTKGAYSTFFGGSGDDARAGHMTFYSSPLNELQPGDELESSYTGASAGIAVLGETAYLTFSTASTDLITANPPARVGPDTKCGTDGTCDSWASRCLPVCTVVQQFTDVFVAELDTSLNSTKDLRFATYLGGGHDEVATGIAVTAAADDTRIFITSTPGATLSKLAATPCPREAHCSAPCTIYGVTNSCGVYHDPRDDVPDVPEDIDELDDTDLPEQIDVPPLTPSPPIPSVDNLFSILPEKSGEDSRGWTAAIGHAVALGVAVDAGGNPHVTGYSSSGLATTEGAFQLNPAGKQDAFVAKFDRDSPELQYATYLGGNQSDVGQAIAVDGAGRVFVSGYTNSFDDTGTPGLDEAFPTRHAVQPKPACPADTAPLGGGCFGQTNGENVDAFVAGLDPDLGKSGLVWSTYLGGRTAGPGFGPNPAGDPSLDTTAEGRRDEGRAIALGNAPASEPSVYVGGLTNSRDFPLIDSFGDFNGGSGDGFVTRFVPGGPQPQVLGLVPASGTASGGDTVTLHGAHLADVTSLRFGDHTCPSAICTFTRNATTMTLTIPPLFDESSRTTVDIVLTDPKVGKSLRTHASKFTYLDGRWDKTGAMSGEGSARSATVLDGPACRDISPPAYCGKTLVVRVAATGKGRTFADLYDPKTGQWSSSACSGSTTPSPSCPEDLAHHRSGRTKASHTATLLDGPECQRSLVELPPQYCGKVLVAGGAVEATAELYDPATGQWDDTAKLAINRSNHTATLLSGPNCGSNCGKVLVVGGHGSPGGHLETDSASLAAAAATSAELYSPKAGLAVQTPNPDPPPVEGPDPAPVETPDLCPSASTTTTSTTPSSTTTTTPDSPPCQTPDYDPPPVRGEDLNPVETPDLCPSASTMPSSTTTTTLVSACQTPDYDPPQVGYDQRAVQVADVDAHWALAGVMRAERFEGHTATQLVGPECTGNSPPHHCGRVLVVGGDADRGSDVERQGVVEIYDPLAPVPVAFALALRAEPGEPRSDHSATLLEGTGCEPDCGKVLLVGGGTPAVELYDPAVTELANAFSHHSQLSDDRSGHSAVLLPGARVLLTGGRTEVYDRRAGGWRPGPAGARTGPAVLLKGAGSVVDDPGMCGSNCGKVLVADRVVKGSASPSAELYTPAPWAAKMDPSSGPADGGTTVSIAGHGLDGDMAVYFGTTRACGAGLGACGLGSYSTMAAASPAVSDHASPQVWVARRGVGITRVPRSFEYVGPPGAVVPFLAEPRSDTEIQLSLGAAGSVGTGNPPVKDYIVKHSRSVIDGSNFDSASALCEGGICSFEPTRVGEVLSLRVTNLHPGTRHYFAVRARRSADQLGPIALADAATTGLAPVSPESDLPPPAPDVGGVGDLLVRYERGYSLVGLPQGSVVASQSPLYGWFDQGARNAQGRTAAYSTQASDRPVAAGRGYWAWFSSPQAVKLSGPGVSALDLPLGGYRASMVGNPSGTATSTIAGHDYTARWDPELNNGVGGYHISGYQQPQDLEVGEGIWAFSYRDTTLRLRAR